MKPTTLKCLLILLLFTAMSCRESIIDQTLNLDKEITVRLNQLYTSENGQYSLKLTEINDSRCPEGVYCFWQGEVSIKGEWTEKGNKSEIELHSVLTNLEKNPGGYTIKIVNVKSGENSATLLIQKK